MATTAVEKSKTRSDLAQLAGRGPFSAVAMLAGVLVGYSVFALLLGGAVAILRANGSALDLSESWGDLGNRGGVLLGGLLFVSYLFAGYITGRMAWRRGEAHGLLLVLGSIVLVGVAAGLLHTFTQPDDVRGITDALRSFGVPTTGEEWRNVSAVVWVASLCGMLLGSVLGGMIGERWFTKVSRRALDAEIDLRERLEAADERLAPIDDGRTKGEGNGHRARTDKSTADADVIELDSLSKEELYHLAQEEDIPGRSQMSKEQLAAALRQGPGTLQKR
ncbi:MAG: Rho termination factor N-terminal domain-containing protein [Acidimicrobiia bacterium]